MATDILEGTIVFGVILSIRRDMPSDMPHHIVQGMGASQAYERIWSLRKNMYLVRKNFDLAFFNMCDLRHMYSVTKHEKLFAEVLSPYKRSLTFWLQLRCDFLFLWNYSYVERVQKAYAERETKISTLLVKL